MIQHTNTRSIFSPFPQPKERFVLKADKSLERIAKDTPTPEGHIAVFNPLVNGAYVERDNVLYRLPESKVKIADGVWQNVPQIPAGTKPYEFPEQFAVYVRV